MPPNFFDPLAASFWDMLQLAIGAAVTTLTIKFSGWKSAKEKELAERRVKDAEIMARLDDLANQSQTVKEEVKNTHTTNLRHDLDKVREISTQALKNSEQIKGTLDSLAGDFRESKREHTDFRERHNRSAEDIQDLNKRVNALFSTINKENNHE